MQVAGHGHDDTGAAAAMPTDEPDAAGDEYRLLRHAACALAHLVTSSTGSGASQGALPSGINGTDGGTLVCLQEQLGVASNGCLMPCVVH